MEKILFLHIILMLISCGGQNFTPRKKFYIDSASISAVAFENNPQKTSKVEKKETKKTTKTDKKKTEKKAKTTKKTSKKSTKKAQKPVEKPIKTENKAVENIIIDHHQTEASTFENQKIQIVVEEAKSYLGTPYKYAGNTRNGMDCSGLMSVCFSEIGMKLNRSSDGIALQGEDINLNEVKVGDLLFFKTSKTRAISHVGLVVEVGNDIKFIHSSTSRGVIISSLDEPYWTKTYVKAQKIIR